jgi:acyl carrier protein
MKDEIVAVVAEYLDIDPSELDETKTLDDLKIDSLDFIEIMFEIEEKFDAPVTAEIQEHRENIGNFGDVLRITEDLIVRHRVTEAAESGA